MLPLAAAAERYPDLVAAHLGLGRPARGPVRRPQRGPLAAAARSSTSRAASVLDRPRRALARSREPAGTALHWRTPDRARGGRRGRGLGAVPVRRPRGRAACSTASSSWSSATARVLRYVCGQGLSDDSWVFASQRAEVGRDASLEWVALGFGSAHGKVRMETRLGGEGASAKVTGVYARRRDAAPRLRHDPGARRAHTPPPTSPSAACSPTARPRCGAG